MEKHDLSQLESKLKEFQDACSTLSDDSDIVELLKIIHRPGWTTLAEVSFVNGAADSLVRQVRNVVAQRQALLSASRQVEVGQAASR